MSDDYRVYSVSHTNEKNEDGGRAYTLQASYDSAELAVAAVSGRPRPRTLGYGSSTTTK